MAMRAIRVSDEKYIRTMNEIRESFGGNEFTRAEYNKMMRGRNVLNLDALVGYGVCKVREEHFTVHLDEHNGRMQSVLKTLDGKVLTDLKPHDYVYVTSVVKKIFDQVFNNGMPLKVTEECVYEVEGTRYYYAFDEKAYKKRIDILKRMTEKSVISVNLRMAKLNKRLEVCNKMALALAD